MERRLSIRDGGGNQLRQSMQSRALLNVGKGVYYHYSEFHQYRMNVVSST